MTEVRENNEVCAYCGKEVFHNGFNYEHVGGGAFCRNEEGKPRMVEPGAGAHAEEKGSNV